MNRLLDLLVSAIAVVIAVGVHPAPADAGQADWTSLEYWTAPSPGIGAEAVKIVAELNLRPPALALAAHVSAEGHWTFTNAIGQRFTAASPVEMARVAEMLAPVRAAAKGPLILYVTAPSVITHAEHLNLLPPAARLRIVTGGASYPLTVARTQNEAPLWFAEVSPNVFLRADRIGSFDEAAWQLRRPVRGRRMRVVALDPEGPVALAPRPPARRGGEPVVEPVAPSALADAIAALTGQVVVVTGRLEADDRLAYRTPGGAERAIDVAPLRAAAAKADVDLILLNASAPRQPGARNWLWLRVDVDNLDQALGQETLGRFLNALARDRGRLFVTARRTRQGRLALSVVPLSAAADGDTPGTFSNLFAEIVSEVAGTVLPHAVEADLTARQRIEERRYRLLPGIPASAQFVYLAALLVGLVALPVALSWWRRIWPGEVRAEYADRQGFVLASLVRWSVFGLVFLPLVAGPALIWMVLRLPFQSGRKAQSSETKADARRLNR